MDDILQAREDKSLLINEYLKEYANVITLKANIPDVNKNIVEAYILTNIFKNILVSKNYTLISIHESQDGPFIVFTYKNKNVYDIKNQLVELEESHPLGRLIDIDVYTLDGTLTRKKVRKCYLCNNSFHECRMKKRHSSDDLLHFIKTMVNDYLIKFINDAINTSMIKELDLHPKFGLVTPFSNGSHKDMNYKLMIKARDAIMPYFIDMFKIGYSIDFLESKFLKAKEIGILAELSMNKATNNINAYKGLIFILGLVIVSLGHALVNNQKYEPIYENIKVMCKDIYSDIDKLDKTPGITYYQNYNFKGARGEAKEGLLSIKEIVKLLEKNNTLNDEVLTMSLINLLKSTDDSVLLKRSGSLEKYYFNKNLITSITKYEKRKIEEITDYCINNNLSLGGCADLLIASIFIYITKNHLL